jgi:iron complex transport system substrate-binding protein
MFKRICIVLAAALSTSSTLVASDVGADVARLSPTCVVSLSPTATETLYAIGAGSQVKAVDNDSNFPTTGLPTKRINALSPSVEAILAICPKTASHPSSKPDLVIISFDANTIKEKLTALGVKVVEQDAATSVANALTQIRQLGALTGHQARANALAAALNRTIKSDIASVPAHPKKVVRVYYELDPTYYSLTSTTFVGSLMKSLGLVNIADPKSTTADAGYPQLSAEYIVSANPTVIFLADTKCCHATLATVAKRPGFSKVSAVVHAHVVNLNDDVASRWGPRLGLLMNQLTAAVKRVLSDSRLGG